MTAETDQKDERQNEQGTEQQDSAPEGQNQQSSRSSSSTNLPARHDEATPARGETRSGAQGNPRNAARLGLLHMAREWREQGSVYQALHAYEEILGRYPGTGVAAAATEELLEMARKLEAQGQFRGALEIFHKLEEYGVDQ
jgi:tetratricopeptide (TPR) repeat protein